MKGNDVFRVCNQNVPYVLDFCLRGQGLNRWALPSVSGGGMAWGQVKDYPVYLQKGEYMYSCPLNPTLDYPLVVN